jgi:hypothetical protein
VPEKKKFEENPNISYIEFGETLRGIPLQSVTTYPHGAGFPYFTWAQLFFTNVDQVVFYNLLLDYYKFRKSSGFLRTTISESPLCIHCLTFQR